MCTVWSIITKVSELVDKYGVGDNDNYNWRLAEGIHHSQTIKPVREDPAALGMQAAPSHCPRLNAKVRSVR